MAALYRSLQHRQWAFDADLICDDEIAVNIETVMAAYGYPSVSAERVGDTDLFRIEGDIVGADRLLQASAALRGVPGLARFEFVNRKADCFDALLKTLRRSGVLRKLGIWHDGHHVLITGLLSKRDEAKLKAALATAACAAQKLTIEYERVAASLDGAGLFASKVTGVGTSASDTFIDFADGTTVTLGSVLPNGYAVQAIDNNGLDLQRGQAFVHLPLDF